MGKVVRFSRLRTLISVRLETNSLDAASRAAQAMKLKHFQMKNNYIIELFNPRKRSWYWRLKSSRNGKIVADGSEAYTTKSSVVRAVKRLKTINFAALEAKEVNR